MAVPLKSNPSFRAQRGISYSRHGAAFWMLMDITELFKLPVFAGRKACVRMINRVFLYHFDNLEDLRIDRKDYSPENMAMVRHIILNRLQNTKKKFNDRSIKRLQKKAGWGDSTLDMILMADF